MFDLFTKVRFLQLVIALSAIIASDSSRGGFSKDGRLEDLEASHDLISLSNSSSIGIAFNGTTRVLIGLQKVDNSSFRRFQSLISHHRGVFSAVVGQGVDAQEGRRLVMDKSDELARRLGLNADAGAVALALADDAQSRSMYPSRDSLSFNILLMDGRALFKVDVFGTLFKCVASCVGFLENKVNTWMPRRGAYLVSKMINNSETNTNSTDDGADVAIVAAAVDTDEDKDMKRCLYLAWKCLNETVGADVLAKCFVEIATTDTNGRSYGPFVIPQSLFEELKISPPNANPNNNKTEGSTHNGGGREEEKEEGEGLDTNMRTPLYRWWKQTTTMATTIRGRTR